MQSVQNEEERKKKKLFQNFAHLYLAIGWSNLLQIWYLVQGISAANLGKISQSYIGVKITFFVFLSLYSCCSMMASWAARHTTVCLDIC